ncbi:MAG: tRNA (guanine(10)-N(2))-dimethyltransferase [Candidatus Bathyarchaeota archaeon]|jgi:tRNA (guanine26-N2/guanine27-N2)-dimethyltransferase|nr:tRNA (guanine(10)-N(2))-dimethyltransferase [Candidatus Bathyarchaeota archaeon]
MDFPTEIVHEGKVEILVPKLSAFVKKPSEYAPSKAPVFYNPVMELNRDIAVLALQAYQRTVNRKIIICEPLAGCGVRGIRFATEVEGVKKVLINDINEKAFNLARANVQRNKLSRRITVRNEDANRFLSHYGAPRKRFDAIDIDPFGSPVPYLDSAIRALRDGGFIALTATDMAPLCGVYPKACIRKYGGKPLRTEYCHELAVRLLAGCLAMTAAKYDIGISVIFSHSTNHYIRLYAKIAYGAKKADESIKNMGYIMHCFNCFHREALKAPSLMGRSGKCSQCSSKLDYVGPLWLGKIFDKNFCENMEKIAEHMTLGCKAKVMKILALIKDEVDGPPTYYVINKLCDKLEIPVPSVRWVLKALRGKGFQACPTHFNFNGVRTNASVIEIMNVLKSCINKEHDKF